jgi:hypothetical protein
MPPLGADAHDPRRKKAAEPKPAAALSNLEVSAEPCTPRDAIGTTPHLPARKRR